MKDSSGIQKTALYSNSKRPVRFPKLKVAGSNPAGLSLSMNDAFFRIDIAVQDHTVRRR